MQQSKNSPLKEGRELSLYSELQRLSRIGDRILTGDCSFKIKAVATHAIEQRRGIRIQLSLYKCFVILKDVVKPCKKNSSLYL